MKYLSIASIVDGENWYNYTSTFGTSTLSFHTFHSFSGLQESMIIDTKSGDSPCKKGSSDCSVKGASDKHTLQEDDKVKQPETFCIF